MVRVERARLQRLFQRLLLVSLAVPGGIYACSSASSGDGTGQPGVDGGANDSTFGNDSNAPPPDDGSMPGVDAPPPGDAGVDAGNFCKNSHSDGYFNDASWVTIADAARECYYFIDFPNGADCNEKGCYFYLKDCPSICTLDGGTGPFFDCHLWTGCSDGAITDPPGSPQTVACGLCNGVGRRPVGLARAGEPHASDPLGEWFARAAHLEAASVHAFAALREELVALRAPAPLVRAAERSRKDEVRHAARTAAIARKNGAAPAKVRVRKRRGARSLEAIARENAVEGCVRETFGAMVATWQAAHAADADVAQAMKGIAADETRHAALAWAVARWVEPQLSPSARARVERARTRAAEKLVRELDAELPADLRRRAGLPDAATARAIASRMSGALWDAAA
jgi:hypothetical protein